MILHYLRAGPSRVSSLGKMGPEDIEPRSEMGQMYLVDCPYVVPVTMGPDSKLRRANNKGPNRMPQENERETYIKISRNWIESLCFIQRGIIAYGQKLMFKMPSCYLQSHGKAIGDLFLTLKCINRLFEL